MAKGQSDRGPGAEGDASTPSRRPKVYILLTFVGVFALLLIVFNKVLFPFLMAIYLAYLVEPIVQRVVRSRLLGIKWTRGPTIVTLYVLVLGGLSVLGWIGMTKLAKTITSTSRSVARSLEEEGYRAHFEFPAREGTALAGPGKGDEGDELGIVIPKGTRLVVRGEPYVTLFKVEVGPEERTSKALLEYDGTLKPAPTMRAQESARFADIVGLTYSNGEQVKLADAERLRVSAGESATGLEYFVERRFISPIADNLADVGFDIEPTLFRDYVAIKGESLREDLPQTVGKGAVAFAGRLVFSVYEFFLILMLTAFIVMDRKRIAGFWASLPPPRYQPAYLSLVKYVDDGLAGVIRGQLVICGVNGVLTYIGLLLIGVPYALLLASIAAVLSLIPVFGTIVSSIPIVLIALTQGLNIAIFALLWIVFIHALEGNILNPMIMGSHARMHPVIIIFSLLAGEHSFGIWGALLAVPTMSIIQSCFRFYLHEVEGLPRDDDDDGHSGLIGTAWKKITGAFAGKKPATTEADA